MTFKEELFALLRQLDEDVATVRSQGYVSLANRMAETVGKLVEMVGEIEEE
jgi:hypothetical protein